MCDKRQAQKLGEVFAVESKRTAVKRADALRLGAERVGQGGSRLRRLRGVFRQRGHDNLATRFGTFRARPRKGVGGASMCSRRTLAGSAVKGGSPASIW